MKAFAQTRVWWINPECHAKDTNNQEVDLYAQLVLEQIMYETALLGLSDFRSDDTEKDDDMTFEALIVQLQTQER